MKKGNIITSVSDTGIGMSAAEQVKLFEKFYRVKNSETQKILSEQKAGNKEYLAIDPYFKSTNLNGKYIKSAKIELSSAELPHAALSSKQTRSSVLF